jgi:hypothetical protein
MSTEILHQIMGTTIQMTISAHTLPAIYQLQPFFKIYRVCFIEETIVSNDTEHSA